MNLPRWQCHKLVSADKITNISIISPVEEITPPTDYDVVFELACGESVSVSKTFIVRGTPKEGDYFIVYDDGYQSWSPASVFEAGYIPY